MNYSNIKKLSIIILIGSVILLAGCSEGDTKSGFGGSLNEALDTSGGVSTNEAIVLPETDVPAHCAKLGYTFVPRKIPCSDISYARCDCWNPADPAQSPK